MKLAAIITCFSLFHLTGCQSTQISIAEQLKQQTYQLVSVGTEQPATTTVTLSFNEGMRINGFTGCNQFFGQGQLRNLRFKVEQLGMTRKSCTAPLNEIERLLISTLKTSTAIALSQETLTLGTNRPLTFKRVTATAVLNPQ